jgi:hypothetical protein
MPLFQEILKLINVLHAMHETDLHWLVKQSVEVAESIFSFLIQRCLHTLLMYGHQLPCFRKLLLV